ncbi:helix-turn-helix domain-containing protein [Sinorhizobium sp. 7-81]|uniref:helix-turn-helix domain-containing protein n=1 Tax=Sinorhizobium sp. 8-89 TaxID=3049089 RepID=UPI0024C3BDD8|nr:helix-turn-helix domain-containing protein [Sinorhizobium sp. 8-89]MDK1493718.1 helix-turn-helix domain-containing protein [Sinorhizobium sp. 8-89]
MPASAVHRLLATLAGQGWVIQDTTSQKYALSLRMSTLAFRNLDARNVPDGAIHFR